MGIDSILLYRESLLLRRVNMVNQPKKSLNTSKGITLGRSRWSKIQSDRPASRLRLTFGLCLLIDRLSRGF